MVDVQLLARVAAHAAVSVPEPCRSPQLLPGRGVDFRPRGAGAVRLGAADAAAERVSGEDRAAARANASQHGLTSSATEASVVVPGRIGS